MEKLKAILSGANFIDRLFDLRERDVKRSLESASDDAERQMTEAEIRYEDFVKNWEKMKSTTRQQSIRCWSKKTSSAGQKKQLKP